MSYNVQPPAGEMSDEALGMLLRVAAERPSMFFGTEIPDEMRDALREASDRLRRSDIIPDNARKTETPAPPPPPKPGDMIRDIRPNDPFKKIRH